MDQCKTCSGCRESLPVAEFTKNRHMKDGLSHYCRPCKSRAASDRYKRQSARLRTEFARWYSENRELALANARTRRAADPEKARQVSRLSKRRKYEEDPVPVLLANAARHAQLKKGVRVYDVTPEKVREKLEYWGNQCWMCGGSYESLDHVKPLRANGPHMLANLRPSCRSCNSRKQGRWPLPTLQRK